MTNEARAAITVHLDAIAEPRYSRDWQAYDAHSGAADACDEAAMAEARGNEREMASTAEWAQLATDISQVATERTHRRMHASWEAVRQVKDATTLDQDGEGRMANWESATSWHRTAAQLHRTFGL